MTVKKRGLGKGLEALLSTSHAAAQKQSNATSSSAVNEGESLQHLAIELLRPGKYQPRKDMSSEALEELTESIKAQGIIQPIVVRPIQQGQYEIIAGERRWRAAQAAGLSSVPTLVKPVEDEAAVAIALIENIQREDLNSMEEAIALQRLMDEFEMTHQQVAQAVGKSRSTVSNLLRLNGLEEDVKRMLEHGDIEMGHARALLAIEGTEQVQAARQVVGKELNVRETEKLVQQLLNPTPKPAPKSPDPDIVSLQNKLSDQFGAKVEIKHTKKGKGKLVIDYADLAHLDGILAKLS
ncbi:ParB/RepB/Spo0J family partition protein [Paraferrimonas sedimenticola]|uniref:Probable chromosome-partitioning protein ParB n=1 Tax=Paraferrimonas sedimenticola TaxID=375674 RepID=A0AA37RZ61_9GAMM|nr:ParB/RepB/Spo0J family partition protein [Paraferrimonas sedimenticola]GLP97664.1 chromosome partitioning protein ParB [Paraferrimonas sedimenticola]